MSTAAIVLEGGATIEVWSDKVYQGEINGPGRHVQTMGISMKGVGPYIHTYIGGVLDPYRARALATALNAAADEVEAA